MTEEKYLLWSIDQQYLLPPSLRDWLPESHVVYRFLELVNQLDISEITARDRTKDSRGRRSYHPRMMLALLMWSYSQGIYSSRRIEKATYEQIPFRVLTGNQQPHFTVINEFRSRNIEAFCDLFLQVLLMGAGLGMVKLGHIALDGTKIKANASKHKAMSYKRMQKEISRYEREIKHLVARAEGEDRAEDSEGCPGPTEDELPGELQRREERLERIKQLKAALEADARRARSAELRERAQGLRQRAATETDETEKKRKLTRAQKNEDHAKELDDDEDGPPGANGADDTGDLPEHRVPTTKNGEPTDKAQRNFVDSDSRIMKLNGEYIQGFNAQIVVDAEHQVIIAQAVTNQAPDQQHLIPLLDRAADVFDLPGAFSADAGYTAEYNVEYCEANGIDAYIATKRDKHGETEGTAEARQQLDTQNPTALQRMIMKMQSPEAKAVYARRKVIPEPVFGQIKEPRGFRRFSLRGLRKVRGEWTLVCLCHNILKILSVSPGLGRRFLLSNSVLDSLQSSVLRLSAFLGESICRIPCCGEDTICAPCFRTHFQLLGARQCPTGS